eukprot:TRINITY_DN21012_c0_g1_i1.p1 TRINITY_DN21012_c0_g1~~TRINITY_DN21012_c0_g1_i1.p1  ORF type:complete len:1765 (-),score=380.49 TRINITY_DN21012_c0_g1_i1:121-5415(-)
MADAADTVEPRLEACADAADEMKTDGIEGMEQPCGAPTTGSSGSGSNNAADPVASPAASESSLLGKEKDWADMTAQERHAVATLGWTEQSWTDGDTAAYYKAWASLSDAQRAAATVLGMTPEEFEEPVEEINAADDAAAADAPEAGATASSVAMEVDSKSSPSEALDALSENLPRPKQLPLLCVKNEPDNEERTQAAGDAADLGSYATVDLRFKLVKAAWCAASGGGWQQWFSSQGTKPVLVERMKVGLQLLKETNYAEYEQLEKVVLAPGRFDFKTAMERFSLDWKTTVHLMKVGKPGGHGKRPVSDGADSSAQKRIKEEPRESPRPPAAAVLVEDLTTPTEIDECPWLEKEVDGTLMQRILAATLSLMESATRMELMTHFEATLAALTKSGAGSQRISRSLLTEKFNLQAYLEGYMLGNLWDRLTPAGRKSDSTATSQKRPPAHDPSRGRWKVGRLSVDNAASAVASGEATGGDLQAQDDASATRCIAIACQGLGQCVNTSKDASRLCGIHLRSKNRGIHVQTINEGTRELQGKDKDWKLLSALERSYAERLGFTSRTWRSGVVQGSCEDSASADAWWADMPWENLSPPQREAARLLGWSCEDVREASNRERSEDAVDGHGAASGDSLSKILESELNIIMDGGSDSSEAVVVGDKAASEGHSEVESGWEPSRQGTESEILLQSAVLMVDRLRVVKAVWAKAGGLSRPWYNQLGTKVKLLERVNAGLDEYQAATLLPSSEQLSLQPERLRAVALALNFSLEGAMLACGTSWTEFCSIAKVARVPKLSVGSNSKELPGVERDLSGKRGADSQDPVIVASEKVGAGATVFLSTDPKLVPAGLLPPSAKVRPLPAAQKRAVLASLHPATRGAAEARGLKTRAAWAGLGSVPEGIPENFRCVLFCGDSGSGKTTAMRNFLASRYPTLHKQKGSFVQLRDAATGFRRGHSGIGFVVDASPFCEEVFVKLEDGTTAEISAANTVAAVAPELGVATWGTDSLLRAFGQSEADIEAGINALTAVGLSSVPLWFKPYRVLSRGQQYRANIAMLMHKRQAGAAMALDEFTSELDRPVAKMLAIALRKRMISQEEKGWVMATCNEDIIPCLAPDWLVICESNKAPRLIPGPGQPGKVTIMSELYSSFSEDWGLSGQWVPEKGLGSIKIRPLEVHENSRRQAVKDKYTIAMQGREVGPKAPELIDMGDDCLEAILADGVSHVKIRVTARTANGSASELEVVDSAADVVDNRLTRGPPKTYKVKRVGPAFQRVDFDLLTDPDLRNAGVSYSGVSLEKMKARRWFLPAHLDASRFGGLKVLSESDCSERFDFNPKASANATVLASYVGDETGFLAPGLEQANDLLDTSFDGICQHTLPSVKLPLKDKKIAVVVGPSGSGKSSLVRMQVRQPLVLEWDNFASVLEHFKDFALAEKVLAGACLPLQTAMAPHSQLSRGEQSRADLARIIAWGVENPDEKPIVIQEFTSLMDRTTAKSVASNLRRFVSEHTLPMLVLVSCHEDLVGVDLLEPDWVFDTRCSILSKLARGEKPSKSIDTSKGPKQNGSTASTGTKWDSAAASHLQSLTLEVRRALPCEWRSFREYHYKCHKLHAVAFCWLASVNGVPVGFTAACIQAPNPLLHGKLGTHPGFGDRKLDTKPEVFDAVPEDWLGWQLIRESRTVILPDYQGCGIGSALSDAVARDLQLNGMTYQSLTIHPFFGSYRDRSQFWRPFPNNREPDKKKRPKYNHFWVGDAAANISPEERQAVAAALNTRVKVKHY